MKIFWSFIALLALITTVLVVFPEVTDLPSELIKTTKDSEATQAEAMNEKPGTVDEEASAEASPAKIEEKEPAKLDPPSEDLVPPVSETPEETPDQDEAPKGEEDRLSELVAQLNKTNNEQGESESKEIAEDLTEANDASAATLDELLEIEPVAKGESETDTGAQVAKVDEANTPPWEEEEAKEAKKSRDESVADDVFEIKGKGTKDDPYRVTWELLSSAYETYRPREEKTDIPERIQNLHEKYVRISGYLAFPMMTGEVTEALVMLNQWDGCCLGVPPSPYDSIEVTMTEPVEANMGPFTPFGAVEGKLLVDPYLVNGWLVGLFLMEEATVETVG